MLIPCIYMKFNEYTILGMVQHCQALKGTHQSLYVCVCDTNLCSQKISGNHNFFKNRGGPNFEGRAGMIIYQLS
jgi:hypothetical protein